MGLHGIGALLTLGRPRAQGNPLYFSVANVSIAPQVGNELLINGDFSAWTGDNPDGWTVLGESGADPAASEVGTGETHEGAGTGSCNLYSSETSFVPSVRQAVLTIGDWYKVNVLTSQLSGAGTANVRLGDDTIARLYVTATGQAIFTAMAQLGSFYCRVLAAPVDWTIDEVSVKKITDHHKLYDHAAYYGDYSVDFTRDSGYQAGVFACYEDADNWLHLVCDGNQRAYLIKRVAGTVSVVNSWPLSYVAGKTLTLRVNTDGTLDVLYNGDTLASGLADTGLRGTKGGPFSTDASKVAINRYTWDARDF